MHESHETIIAEPQISCGAVWTINHAGRERHNQPTPQQRSGTPRDSNRPYVPPARRNNFINAVQQQKDEWPQEDSDEGDGIDPQLTTTKHSAGKSLPLTWLFTIICLTMTTGTTNSQNIPTPMLCQSHAAQQIFRLPTTFCCMMINRHRPMRQTL